MHLLPMLAGLALAGPDLDIAAGGGLFTPVRRPQNPGFTTDAQCDAYELIEPVPDLGLSAGAQIGLWPTYGCPAGSCPAAFGVGRLGLGPSYRLPLVDLALFARLVRFGGSGPVYVDPAFQATFRADVGSTTLRPYVGLENLRSPDLQTGVRIAIPTGGDGTRTRERVCTDGETREKKPGNRQSLSYSEPTSPTPELELDWGRFENLDDESKDALGKMKNLLSTMLTIKNTALSAKKLKDGEADVTDVLGRTQDAVSAAGLTDWSVPITPQDVPEALAQNYLEIGQRAVTALVGKLDRHKETYLHEAHAWYMLETVSYECYELEICEEGQWRDHGWWVDDATIQRSERRVDLQARIPTGRSTVSSQIRALMAMLDRQMARLSFWRSDVFESSENPCAASDAFDATDVFVPPPPDGPSQDECDAWRRKRAGLDSERRGLVGSYAELLKDQLEWERSQAQAECDYRESSVRFYEERLDKNRELAQLTGGEVDPSIQEGLDAHQQALDEHCKRVEELGQTLAGLEARLAAGPARIAEIDAELAELDRKLADCR